MLIFIFITVMRRYETERDTADGLRSQLAEREANAAEIERMLEAADEERERLSAELDDTKEELADVQSKLAGAEAADEERERLSEELDDTKQKLADVQAKLEGVEAVDEERERLTVELDETKQKLADFQSKLAVPAPALDHAFADDNSSYPAKPKKKGNRKRGAGNGKHASGTVVAEVEKQLNDDVARLEKSLAQQDTLTSTLEKVAEETKAYARDLKKQLEEAMLEKEAAKAQTAAAQEVNERLAVALECTQQDLAEVETELASQEQFVVDVGAAAVAGKKREIEMVRLLQEAATAEAVLEADLAATKQSLSDIQETLATATLKSGPEEAAEEKEGAEEVEAEGATVLAAAGMRKDEKAAPDVEKKKAEAKARAKAREDTEVLYIKALKEAAEEEGRLVTDVIRLEKALTQQNVFMTQQGKAVQASKTEAASLKNQLQGKGRWISNSSSSKPPPDALFDCQVWLGNPT